MLSFVVSEELPETLGAAQLSGLAVRPPFLRFLRRSKPASVGKRVLSSSGLESAEATFASFVASMGDEPWGNVYQQRWAKREEQSEAPRCASWSHAKMPSPLAGSSCVKPMLVRRSLCAHEDAGKWVLWPAAWWQCRATMQPAWQGFGSLFQEICANITSPRIYIAKDSEQCDREVALKLEVKDKL